MLRGDDAATIKECPVMTKKYKAIVTTGAQDVNGLALAKAHAWMFTTVRS